MISSLNEDPAHNTYAQLVGFYLATRYAVAFHFAINYFLLPMIRGFMLASCIQVLVPTALWIGSIYVDMPNRLILIWIAIVLDMWGQIFYFAPVQYTLRYKEESDTPFTRWVRNMFDYIPAVNIEHRVERTNAFVSLVLGYSVVGILFQSNGGYNINAFLGKAILGLLQAFFFNWIYFDVDGNGIELHAIRRSAVASKCLWGRYRAAGNILTTFFQWAFGTMRTCRSSWATSLPHRPCRDLSSRPTCPTRTRSS